ncbi:hypothetical protein PanWU01x14_295340 [Parasponia andersonii]|uniref:Root meristem growth factor n=1 Tax=Parasponia andersonii TaxID=3476 RepID=A0A2P5AVR6_PARAD|nr:hypothetical protein PanWU01x14_295340 [Parasponia andersonii]
MSSVALLFLLCLTTSLHACNGRLLAFIDKQVEIKIQHFDEVLEKATLSDETPNPKPTSVTSVEHQAQEEAGSKHENGGADALKQKIPVAPLSIKQEQPAAIDGKTTGNELTKPYFQIELKRSIEISKGQNGQARSMLGYTPQDTEEAVDTRENDSVDDIEMMDYAQPHRKPPIHNERP